MECIQPQVFATWVFFPYFSLSVFLINIHVCLSAGTSNWPLECVLCVLVYNCLNTRPSSQTIPCERCVYLTVFCARRNKHSAPIVALNGLRNLSCSAKDKIHRLFVVVVPLFIIYLRLHMCFVTAYRSAAFDLSSLVARIASSVSTINRSSESIF